MDFLISLCALFLHMKKNPLLITLADTKIQLHPDIFSCQSMLSHINCLSKLIEKSLGRGGTKTELRKNNRLLKVTHLFKLQPLW